MKENFESNRKLRLASYNIRKAKGLDGRHDPGRVVDILAGINADIVAIQEADFRWRGSPAALSPDMIAERSDYSVVQVTPENDSIGWHGNAILVRHDLQVIDVKKLALSGLEPRGALRIDLDIGGNLTVIATHLGLTRYHRQRQLAEIRADVAPELGSTVIMGDFNEWSQKRGLDALTPDFAVYSPGKSFHSAMPVAALDRFALSNDIDLLDAGVVETRASLRASDHLPIWGDVAINGG